MKLASVVATVALLTAIGTVDAQTSTLPKCATTMLVPWNLGANPTACNKEAGYISILYQSPTRSILERFCPNEGCRGMVLGVLALRPVTGDCTVTRGGQPVPFFTEVVDVFATKCEISVATQPPATTTSAPPMTSTPPPTESPVTTMPAPPVTTTAKPADPPVTTTTPVPTDPPVATTVTPPATTTPAPTDATKPTTTPAVTTTSPTPTSTRPAC